MYSLITRIICEPPRFLFVKFVEDSAGSGECQASTDITSVLSLHPKTQMHQCRTQLVSSNNRMKQSLVIMSLFKPGVDSFESERISLSRLDENTIIF